MSLSTDAPSYAILVTHMSSKWSLKAALLATIVLSAQQALFSQGTAPQQAASPTTPTAPPAPVTIGGGGAPPLPSDFPNMPFPKVPRTNAVPTVLPGGRVIVSTNLSQRVFQTPTNAVVLNSTPPLAWDSDFKEITVKPGDVTAYLTFALTNIAKESLTIRSVRPSCGCTLAEIPPVPWILDPGSNGVIKTSVDLRGKRQMVSKSITVDTSHGFKVLSFRVIIPEMTNAVSGTMGDRARNTAIASADRQAVFRGECAKCHVDPGVGKAGLALYTASCGICHDGEHRAAFVPDLKQLKVVTSPEYWRLSIVNGKPGSLMPAFSKTLGGPLTDPQIQSLVDYLSANFKPGVPATVSTLPALSAPVK